MNTLVKIISFIGLALTIVPSIMLFSGNLETDTCKFLMMLGTVLWFSTAPFWMNKGQENEEEG